MKKTWLILGVILLNTGFILPLNSGKTFKVYNNTNSALKVNYAAQYHNIAAGKNKKITFVQNTYLSVEWKEKWYNHGELKNNADLMFKEKNDQLKMKWDGLAMWQDADLKQSST